MIWFSFFHLIINAVWSVASKKVNYRVLMHNIHPKLLYWKIRKNAVFQNYGNFEQYLFKIFLLKWGMLFVFMNYEDVSKVFLFLINRDRDPLKVSKVGDLSQERIIFLSLWYDSIWDWTLVYQTIGEHSIH